MPALFTTISIPPHFSANSSTSLLTAALSVTSHGWTSAAPPAALIASAVSLSLSALRATHATLAPAAASRSAIALPIPREAPVTIAVWPLRSTCIRRLRSLSISSSGIEIEHGGNRENGEIIEKEQRIQFFNRQNVPPHNFKIAIVFSLSSVSCCSKLACLRRDVFARHFAGDASQQSAQHAAGAKFVELRDTSLVEQIPHRVLPADLRADLPDQ